MVDQLRTYYIRRERWAEWEEFFLGTVVPLHEKYGIPVISAWRDSDDATSQGDAPPVQDDVYRFTWIRRFSSEEEAPAEEQRYKDSPERLAVGMAVPLACVTGATVSFVKPVIAPAH